MDRLTELLSPLAERNGHRKSDGDALLEELMRVAGIDQESIAKQITSVPSLGALITAQYLERVGVTPILDSLKKQRAIALPLAQYDQQLAALSEALSRNIWKALPDTTAGIASSALESTRARLAEQLHTVDWALLALATQPAKKETIRDKG